MLNRYKENGAYRRDRQNKQGFDISASFIYYNFFLNILYYIQDCQDLGPKIWYYQC
jgi:hypothetical protein